MEAELDRWADAKADKDYETADAIRADLRARGISPSKERPLHVGAQELVQQWQAAKQAKDYARSDRIREELRAQGIDPQKEVASMGWGMERAFAPMPMRAPMMMHAQPVAVPKRSKMHSLSTMDARVIDELSQWFDAKEQKNWPAADSIRERLRKKGIEPSECQRPGSAGLDDDMEAELGRWYEARDAKDWGTADSIREGLRAGGVEPSQCPRPSASNGGYGKASFHGGARASPYSAGPGLGGFDRTIEQRLDQWWKAKQDKNFGVADAIRKEMRDQNIEPENHRPRR
jgi:cysteinyl-tRNA synthetase